MESQPGFMDNKIREWLQSLGYSVSNHPQAKEPFNVVVSPPQGGPVLNVIRPTPEGRFYVITMGIGIHPMHQNALRDMKEKERREFLSELKYDLLKMGVDFAFLPVNQETPQIVQVSRLVLSELLTPNEFLNSFFVVRNAGLLVILKISDKFGNVAPPQPYRYI
ncbi:MAG: DUF2299 family protein [Candidatus Aramenus sp.]|nr:DUF2299 family protein [Candidatus Aramenus sp.]